MNFIVLYKPEAVEIIKNDAEEFRGEDITPIPGGYVVYLIAITYLEALTKANGMMEKYLARYCCSDTTITGATK